MNRGKKMPDILDDVSRLRSIDRSRMLPILQHTPEDLQEAIKISQPYSTGTAGHSIPSKVVIVGIGGSSIAGDVISNWLSDDVTVPILVSRGLHLPRFAGKDTLVIATSYSGDTNETLGQFDEARRRGCILHVITSGGRLNKISKECDVPVTLLKSGIPPRTAFPQIIVAVSSILRDHDIIRDLSDIQSAGEDLKKIREKLDFAKDTNQNPAKQMALKLVRKFPVIYSLDRMSGTARRLKNQLNENSKVHSKFDVIPEICHNEVESWPELASDIWRSRFSVILIRDDNEDEKERRIVEGTMAFLRRLEIQDLLEIKGTGSNRLAKLLSAIYMGDYVSFYLAIARGIDPTPINEILRLKKEIW
jgi:glucose/mannose-6-phosphate isomerase